MQNGKKHWLIKETQHKFIYADSYLNRISMYVVDLMHLNASFCFGYRCACVAAINITNHAQGYKTVSHFSIDMGYA